MKAVLSVAPGGPQSVGSNDIDEPLPGPNQIRIQVHSCGVNNPDVLLVADAYQVRPPRPFSPGG